MRGGSGTRDSRAVARSRRRARPLAALLAAGIIAAAALPPAAGAQAAGDAVVVGRVLDGHTRTPLPGVTVRLPPSGRQAVTDAAGWFALDGLPSGQHELVVEGTGPALHTAAVRLASGEVVELEIVTTAGADGHGVVAVDVRPSGLLPWLVSNGFAARRAAGDGLLHATGLELRYQAVRSLADVLRRVPGIRVLGRADRGSDIRIEPDPRGGGAPCPVSVYLNGSAVELGGFRWTGVRPAQRATRPLRVDDLLRLDEVDGIELYGPEASPVASDTDCGALLLWSAALRRAVDEPLSGGIRGCVVRDPDGVPVPGARVTLYPPGLETATGPDGCFGFEALPPARYDVVLSVPGAPSWRTTLWLRAHAVADLDVRLEPSDPLRATAAGCRRPRPDGDAAAIATRPTARSGHTQRPCIPRRA